MTRKMFAVAACAALLAGCGAHPQTPAQTVFTVEGSYAAALNIAVAYRHLPTCGGATVVCHDPAVVTKMSAANHAARTALSAAETLVRDETAPADKVAVAVLAAEQLVYQFQALTQTVRVK